MPRTILIADDSEAIRRATRDFLELQTEFKVCGEAIDGSDALDKACDLKPDLVILDLSMPRMNGLQAACAIRRVLHEVPIILFTMYADAIRPQEASSAGVNAVVSKNGELSALAEQIQALLAA
jgi:two-component system, NarL family, response regulator LiaR